MNYCIRIKVGDNHGHVLFDALVFWVHFFITFDGFPRDLSMRDKNNLLPIAFNLRNLGGGDSSIKRPDNKIAASV